MKKVLFLSVIILFFAASNVEAKPKKNKRYHAKSVKMRPGHSTCAHEKAPARYF